MRQRLQRWMIVVTMALTLSATIPQAAFAADEPKQPDANICELCGGGHHKKCSVTSNSSDLMQPGKQCGW